MRSEHTCKIVCVLVLTVFCSLPVRAQNRQVKIAPPFKIVSRTSEELESNAIKRVEPTYPELAREARVSGTVVVEVFIGPLGNVTSARAISGPQLPSMNSVAMKWRSASVPIS